MNMKAIEFHKTQSFGKSTIKLTEDIKKVLHNDMDPGFMGKVLSIKDYNDETYEIILDLSEFESHNRTVAEYNWTNDHGAFGVCWMDTIEYPEDGIYTFWIPIDGEIPFNIVSTEPAEPAELADRYKPTLYDRYMDTDRDMEYEEWLETLVEKLEKTLASIDCKDEGEETDEG